MFAGAECSVIPSSPSAARQVARSVVLADPQLLTCLNWDSTLSRLDRTGVVKLLPAEGEAPEPQRAAAGGAAGARVKQAATTGVGKGSVRPVSEPRRAAKTVKGAAAVAAAMAEAEHSERKAREKLQQQQRKSK